MKAVSTVISATLLSSAVAFAPSIQSAPLAQSLQATKGSFDPLNLADEPKQNDNTVMKFAATAAASFALHPLAAIAEEVDDYEYGAVDAPIGLAWGAGVLAVATALLPIAMQGGEEAFEEMREEDSSTWGTGNSNKLNKRR